MAARVVQLIKDEGLRLRMGAEAAQDVRKRFDVERMAGEYLRWYDKILSDFESQN